MIGSIFIFVLTMGEYGTVTVIGQGAVSSVGTYIQNQIQGIQYPQGAASAVLLVLVLILGVFVITRVSRTSGRSCDARSPAAAVDRPQDKVDQAQAEAPPRLGEVGPRRLLRASS